MESTSKFKKYILPILHFTTLSIVVFSVSVFVIHKSNILIGLVLIGLSCLCLLSIKLFKIKIRSIEPDIVFGMIDNGILVILAIVGSKIAGIAGAIIGGVVGNSITDGIGGIFEGYWAEKLRSKNIQEDRMMLGSSVGKMAGCLLGAGIMLILAGLFNF